MKTLRNKKESLRLKSLFVVILAVAVMYIPQVLASTDLTLDSSDVFAQNTELNASYTLTFSTDRVNTYNSDFDYSILSEGEVIEEVMQLEDWMLSASHAFWNTVLKVDKEEDIELEDWMMDASLW